MSHKRSVLTILLVVLLLTFTVSGTVAWIVDSTDEVENVFTPAKVDTEIVEEFSNNVKSSIIIKNETGENKIPVYVRVALVGNWCDENGNIVEPWTPSFTLEENWFKGSDGYYYYKNVVNVGRATTNLLGSDISGVDSTKTGLHLEVTVIHQSIQAEPTSVVASEWGVTVANDGTISQ